MKKKLIILSICIAFFGAKLNLKAASGYSFSVGTNYDNTDDTSLAAYKANQVTTNMGYSGYLITVPTMDNIRNSKIAGTRYRLESEMLYFAGHAGPTNISWQYLQNSGTYKTGLWNGNYHYTGSNGFYNTGIGAYRMSYVKLAVFMGCNTANGSSNITKYTYDQGAKNTLGWTTIIYGDMYTWTYMFYSGLKDGKNISDSIKYAHTYSYADSSFKNTKLYGTGTMKLNSATIPITQTTNKLDTVFLSELEEKSIIKTPIEYPINQVISDREITSLSEIKYIISQVIKSKINNNFNLSDYIIEKATYDDGNIYDFYYTIDGIKTNSGYVVFTNHNSTEISSIYDNTVKIHDEELLRIKQLNKKEVIEYEYKAFKKLHDFNNAYEQKIDKKYKYYDVKEKKLYYVVNIEESVFELDSNAIVSYKFEIK